MKLVYLPATAILSVIVLSSSGQASLNTELLYHWSDPSLPASFIHNNVYNEVWGIDQGGREYAVIGSTNGTHLFDITDPENASFIHFIPGAAQGGQVIHRHFHDYNGYLYGVCDEGPSTLQIIDISNLPEEVELVYNSNALFSRAHNMYIDEENARMYVCGGNHQYDVYSLENPIAPVLLIRCESQVPGWSTNVGYVHDTYVRDNIAYCNAEDGLWVVDFTNALSPVFLGDLSSYPESGYNHSGWLNEVGDIYGLADETHGMRLKILDVTNPADISVLSLIGSQVNPLSIPHNLIIRDNIMHVSYYHDGYYAFDISDPVNPVVAGYYDTSSVPHANNYRGAWGVYPLLPSGNIIVGDMQEGLFVLRLNQSVGVADQERKLSVYPNPVEAGSEVLGTSAFEEGIFQGSLFDSTGRRLWTGAINNASGSFRWTTPDNLLPGMYVLRIFAGARQTACVRICVR